MKRFIQAEGLKTFHELNFPKSLSRLLLFFMVIATNSGAILVSCCNSDEGPNHFGPFNQICSNIPMV